MKVFNPLKCKADDFATVESDQILTTEYGYSTQDDFSVLVDGNGNVLTTGET